MLSKKKFLVCKKGMIVQKCKHKKLQMQIACLVLHQVKEVGVVTQKEINSECKTLIFISLVLTIVGLVMVQFYIRENQNYTEDAHSLMQ